MNPILIALESTINSGEYEDFKNTLLNLRSDTLLSKKFSDYINGLENEKTPLYLAVERGDIEAVRILLEQPEIDINKQYRYEKSFSFDTGDYETGIVTAHRRLTTIKSPLFCAIERGNMSIIKLLLNSSNIDVNSGYYYHASDEYTPINQSPLQYALKNKNTSASQLLLEYGAGIKSTDINFKQAIAMGIKFDNMIIPGLRTVYFFSVQTAKRNVKGLEKSITNAKELENYLSSLSEIKKIDNLLTVFKSVIHEEPSNDVVLNMYSMLLAWNNRKLSEQCKLAELNLLGRSEKRRPDFDSEVSTIASSVSSITSNLFFEEDPSKISRGLTKRIQQHNPNATVTSKQNNYIKIELDDDDGFEKNTILVATLRRLFNNKIESETDNMIVIPWNDLKSLHIRNFRSVLLQEEHSFSEQIKLELTS